MVGVAAILGLELFQLVIIEKGKVPVGLLGKRKEGRRMISMVIILFFFFIELFVFFMF